MITCITTIVRAIADASRDIDIDPKYVSAYINRGSGYDAKGDHDRAISDYNSAFGNRRRVGFLSSRSGTGSPRLSAAFSGALHELGWIEKENGLS
jgi:hypothetical protein